ncbi:hypothetical protein ACFO4E_06905 [Nocardiopsis mangrovi]|uniref:Uncharacterized protein n=1 Tax=Nocardiopsis mangrovi TaxID=1179818 RepID=A0ABV9DRQ1_9ACTN
MSDPLTRSLPLDVDYAQAYLHDGHAGAETWPDDPDHSAGIIRTPPDPGYAFLVTGTRTGEVGFTVAVGAEDPGPDLDGYEDAVEISVHMPEGTPVIEEWGGDVHELPPLTDGPGWYRLRYHARGFDAGRDDDHCDGGPPDSYLLQIWPAPPAPPQTLRVVSEGVRYWVNEI